MVVIRIVRIIPINRVVTNPYLFKSSNAEAVRRLYVKTLANMLKDGFINPIKTIIL